MSFFEILRECTSFNGNYVSDGSYYYVNPIFFNTLVGMGSRSHDFDDELKNKLFNFIF